MSMVETARPLVHRLTAGAKGQSAVNLGLHLFSTGMGFVASILLSRLLGDEGVGIYFFCFAVANVLGVIGRLGFENLLVREVAKAREHGAWGLIHGLVSWAEGVSLVVSVTLGLAFAAVGWAWWSESDPGTARALLPTVVFVAGTSALVLRSAALRGMHHVVAGQLSGAGIRPLLFVAGLVALTAMGRRDPWAGVLAHGVATIAAWLVAVVLWRRYRPRAQAPARRTREWMASAIPLMLLGGLNLLTTQTDTLMLKGLAGNAATGVYGVAAQLSHVATMVLTVVGAVMAPRFATLLARGDKAELQRVVARSATAITFGTLPITGCLFLFGPAVLALYGEEFGVGYASLVALLCGQFVNAVCGNVGHLMVMSGHEREVGMISLFTAVLNILLNAIFIPHFGSLGAAIATSTSLAVWNLLLVVRVQALLGIHSTALSHFLRLLGTFR